MKTNEMDQLLCRKRLVHKATQGFRSDTWLNDAKYNEQMKNYKRYYDKKHKNDNYHLLCFIM